MTVRRLLPPLVARLLPAALAVTFTLSALADSFSDGVKELKEAADFRVRTQAALNLGSSGKLEAVLPLCSALDDENRTVRIAAATALTKLVRGGVECLRRRKAKETDSAVVASVERALGILDGAVAPTASSRYYVAVDKLSGPERLDYPVRVAFVKAFRAGGSFAIAPRGEAEGEAAKVLGAAKNVKGVLLAPKAIKPKYEGGALEMRIQVAVLTYPGRALLGEFSQRAKVADVTEPDPALEEELLLGATEAAAEKFMKQVGEFEL